MGAELEQVLRLFEDIRDNGYKLFLIEDMDIPHIRVVSKKGELTVHSDDGDFYGYEILSMAIEKFFEDLNLPKEFEIEGFLNWNGVHGIIHYDAKPYTLFVTRSNLSDEMMEPLYQKEMTMQYRMDDYDYIRGVFETSSREGTFTLTPPLLRTIDMSQYDKFINEVIEFCSCEDSIFKNDVHFYEDRPFISQLEGAIRDSGLMDGPANYLTEFTLKGSSKIKTSKGWRHIPSGINFYNDSFDAVNLIVSSLGESVSGDAELIKSREFSLINSADETLAERVANELLSPFDWERITRVDVEKITESIEVINSMLYTTLALFGRKIEYLGNTLPIDITRHHINSIARRIDTLWGMVTDFSEDIRDEEEVTILEVTDLINSIESLKELKFH